MKYFLSFAVLAGILVGLPGARGADLATTITGAWKGAFGLQGKTVWVTFNLAVSGDTITGTIDGLPQSPSNIQQGKIDGDNISVSTDTVYQGQALKLLCDGRYDPSDRQIHFNLSTDHGEWTSTLVLRKVSDTGSPDSNGSAGADSAATGSAADSAQAGAPTPATADVTGTWKGSFDFQGTAVPVTLHLTSTGSSVTGTVEGMLRDAPEKTVDIHDGKLDGKTVNWWLNTQYQGETYKIVYKGTLADGKIDLDFGTEDGSWSAYMTVTRQ